MPFQEIKMAVELRGWPLRKVGASSGTGNKIISKNTLDLLNILVHSKEECVPLVDLEQNLESERAEIILHQGNQ